MRPTECMRPTSLVWIQAGRHGKGDDTLDILNFLTTNDDAHRGSHTVPREYRASEESRREAGCLYKLGVFGSLAGEEVFRNGVMDAGLLDEHFASRGVQGYIDSFGGDPTRVTIAGVSALGRFVMLRDIAYGVILGTPSFVNPISSSSHLSQEHGDKDWITSQAYYAFASAAEFPLQWVYGRSS
ncbi:hypothetical protein BU26DRAFT_604349 [Trematosphaeria pertusa]|uniref:Carboxylesterase type B domain-containing protein n=1 Tax=Trematosphaeria pertusa TaxID=390896 RepID=A0A6A6IJR0_9PLEO|nr:uncharacterized protein BU26DRAFT_604349 [Trematosphaeria pertusa]KAF2250112.1 hypothetical protein BU26DRAFT_604349 [Trematosphaeria pertusa]